MTNRLPVIGVIVAVILFLIWSSIFVVNEREQAIVLRSGEGSITHTARPWARRW